MKEENYLLVELKNGNKVAFTLIFHQYYRDLVILQVIIYRTRSVVKI